MNFLVKNFLRGLAIFIPIGVTAWLVWATIVTIDRWLGVPYPGAGLGVTLVLILLIGIVAGNVIGRTLFEWTEAVFIRAPLVKIIYLAIKDLVEAFVGDKRRFNRPVLVTLSESGEAKALGFITRDRVEFVRSEPLVAVYFPQSYNFAGNVLLFPPHRIQPIEADSSQVMAFIVSGGVSGTPGEHSTAVAE
ncbi:MAG TPA: DUF502 domain-containing protein [Thermoanaerobaculia bacterium]|nr:DUF502 domain-containing protein [Thermoanaerobaculia bacterium]